MFGTRMPSTNSPEPMPVPNVRTSTTPATPRAAPQRTSANPAASASLTIATSSPHASVNSRSASTPTQLLSRFAAEWTTPWCTIPGKPTPSGADQPWRRTSSAAISAIAAGVAGFGVGMRIRSDASAPVSRSTTAAFIPEPPMSMPNPCELTDTNLGATRSDQLRCCRASYHVRPCSRFGSRGSPRTTRRRCWVPGEFAPAKRERRAEQLLPRQAQSG